MSRFPILAESGIGDFPPRFPAGIPDSRPNREWGERELGISGSACTKAGYMLRPTPRPLHAVSSGMAPPLAGAEGPPACALGSTEAAARLHDTLRIIVLTSQCIQEPLAWQANLKASRFALARQDRSMNPGATAFKVNLRRCRSGPFRLQVRPGFRGGLREPRSRGACHI
jgi:hypothetical protein